MRLRVSVVMAVYNGSRYIKDQIISIINQTVKVNEIVIVDDCSTNKCKDIIDGCLSNTDCNLIYHENDNNLGYAQTFFKALEYATGDVVFLSDQDDVWEDNKVAVYLNIMRKHPDILCLSSLNVLINSEGKEIKRERLQYKGLYMVKSNDLISQRILRPGMTLAINKQLLEKVNQYNTSDFEQHDRFIEYLASVENGLFLTDNYLNRYRIHDSNTSGLNLSYNRLRSDRDGRVRQIEKEIKYLELISGINKDDAKEIEKSINYFKTRKQILKKSIPAYILGSLRILLLYPSMRIWFGDLLSIVKDRG